MTYSEQIACMGGNCGLRDSCARYFAPFPALARPVERLCPKGKTLMFVPVKAAFESLKEAA